MPRPNMDRRMVSTKPIAWVAALALAFLSLPPISLASAQTADEAGGVISGRTVDATSGDPLANVQIVVSGTTRGALTGQEGRFRIGQVRPGSYQIEARSTGYRTASRSIQLAADGAAEAVFEMIPSAVPLDEVVVTGQPRSVTRREIGTSIVTIEATELEAAPVGSLSQLLQSRAPGVVVHPGGGKAGQGSRVILRGVSSLTQDVQPIIYVDGMRIDNSADSGLDFGGNSWSGLDDINIQDIDRIEIVRGASAANLYGTEASAGVIQVFTKQGTGEPRSFRLTTEAGVSQTPRSWWAASPHGDWFFDNYVGSGHHHSQHLSARGSVDRFSYYVSGTMRDETGVVAQNGTRQYSLRANTRVSPAQNLSLSIFSAVSLRELELPYDAASPFGFGRNALVRGPDGVDVTPDEISVYNVQLNSTRFTIGAAFDYTPLPQFAHRLTVGGDIVNAGNTDLMPFGTSVFRGGVKESYRPQHTTVTLDYAGSYRHDLSRGVRSTTSLGAQGYLRDYAYVSAVGYNFPMPGLTTINAATSTDGSGNQIRTGAAGLFLEEQLAFHDRLYLNAGLRADTHSAFGPEHRFQFFPKVSLSYVLSEHAAVAEIFNTLRLRAAYGMAGQRPEDYVKARTWQSVRAAGDFAGLTTGNIGNPNLGPEVSRELEMGFDAGLVHDRLVLELTYYNQRTTDVLLPFYYAPSSGFVEPQLENVGTIDNSGLEVTTRVQVVDRSTVGWQLGASAHLARNRISDIGGAEPLNLSSTQWVREGYPVAGFFSDVSDEYIGPAFPTRSLQMTSDLSLGSSLSFALLLDHKGGHYLESNTLRSIDEAGDPVSNPTEDHGDYVRSADSWRLREVSISYALPSSLTRALPLNSARLSVAGRNLWRQQDYTGFEAEAHYNSLSLLGNQTFFDTPLPRHIVAGLSVAF